MCDRDQEEGGTQGDVRDSQEIEGGGKALGAKREAEIDGDKRQINKT
jgi:hypothetical protein